MRHIQNSLPPPPPTEAKAQSDTPLQTHRHNTKIHTTATTKTNIYIGQGLPPPCIGLHTYIHAYIHTFIHRYIHYTYIPYILYIQPTVIKWLQIDIRQTHTIYPHSYNGNTHTSCIQNNNWSQAGYKYRRKSLTANSHARIVTTDTQTKREMETRDRVYRHG